MDEQWGQRRGRVVREGEREDAKEADGVEDRDNEKIVSQNSGTSAIRKRRAPQHSERFSCRPHVTVTSFHHVTVRAPPPAIDFADCPGFVLIMKRHGVTPGFVHKTTFEIEPHSFSAMSIYNSAHVAGVMALPGAKLREARVPFRESERHAPSTPTTEAQAFPSSTPSLAYGRRYRFGRGCRRRPARAVRTLAPPTPDAPRHDCTQCLLHSRPLVPIQSAEAPRRRIESMGMQLMMTMSTLFSPLGTAGHPIK